MFTWCFGWRLKGTPKSEDEAGFGMMAAWSGWVIVEYVGSVSNNPAHSF